MTRVFEFTDLKEDGMSQPSWHQVRMEDFTGHSFRNYPEKYRVLNLYLDQVFLAFREAFLEEHLGKDYYKKYVDEIRHIF